MTAPYVVLGGLSVAVIVMGTIVAVRHRARRFLGLAWIAVGVAGTLATFAPGLFAGTGTASLMMRMRLVLGLLSFTVLMITLEAVRRFAMEERYALLWVSTGAILVVFAVYPDAVGWLAKLTGMQYVSAITVVVFAFLLLVAFHFSLTLSGIRADQRRLCQHTAELALKVAELEKKLTDETGSRKP
jgi:hypothetical protein